MELNDTKLLCSKVKEGGQGNGAHFVDLEEVSQLIESPDWARGKVEYCFSLESTRYDVRVDECDVIFSLSRRSYGFRADSQDAYEHWVALLAHTLERIHERRSGNARRAILCFLAIRRFRRQECEPLACACKEVIGIIVEMVWRSRLECNKLWLTG